MCLQAEAKRKQEAEGAAPQGPRALSRIVSERMSNAEQLLGRRGIASKLEAIKEKHKAGPSEEARPSNRDLSGTHLSRCRLV